MSSSTSTGLKQQSSAAIRRLGIAAEVKDYTRNYVRGTKLIESVTEWPVLEKEMILFRGQPNIRTFPTNKEKGWDFISTSTDITVARDFMQMGNVSQRCCILMIYVQPGVHALMVSTSGESEVLIDGYGVVKAVQTSTIRTKEDIPAYMESELPFIKGWNVQKIWYGPNAKLQAKMSKEKAAAQKAEELKAAAKEEARKLRQAKEDAKKEAQREKQRAYRKSLAERKKLAAAPVSDTVESASTALIPPEEEPADILSAALEGAITPDANLPPPDELFDSSGIESPETTPVSGPVDPDPLPEQPTTAGRRRTQRKRRSTFTKRRKLY